MRILIRSLSTHGDKVLNNLLNLREAAKNEPMSPKQRLAFSAINIKKQNDDPLEVVYIIGFFDNIPLNKQTRKQALPLFGKVHTMMNSVGAKENLDYEVDII